MKPTKADLETFSDLKKVLLESDFVITNEIQDEVWLDLRCRFPKATHFPYFFMVSYNLRQKFIFLVSRTQNSVPAERQGDVLEVLNHSNCYLLNTRLVIPPGLSEVQLRGQMELLLTPLIRDDFRIMLKRFIKSLSLVLTMIDDYLAGKITKE